MVANLFTCCNLSYWDHVDIKEKGLLYHHSSFVPYDEKLPTDTKKIPIL